MSWDRRLLGIVLLMATLGLAESTSAKILLSISPGGGQRPPDPLLRMIDSTDGSTVPGGSVAITLAGHTVIGGTGLARNPQTRLLYALLKLQGASSRRLVSIANEQAGVAKDIGDTGMKFAGLAFGADGTLYTVTGDGASVPETLYTLSTRDASSTALLTLGAGSDGETIAFNPDDGLLYHASGIGTPNDPSGEILETIDLGTLGIANTPLSGFDYEELSAFVHWDGAFFAGDIGNSEVDMPRFFRITESGEVSYLGDMDHVSRGFATVPALSTPILAMLAVTLGLSGVVVRRGRVVTPRCR